MEVAHVALTVVHDVLTGRRILLEPIDRQRRPIDGVDVVVGAWDPEVRMPYPQVVCRDGFNDEGMGTTSALEHPQSRRWVVLPLLVRAVQRA